MLSFRTVIGHLAPNPSRRRSTALRLATARPQIEPMEPRVLLAMPTLWTAEGPGGEERGQGAGGSGGCSFAAVSADRDLADPPQQNVAADAGPRQESAAASHKRRGRAQRP